MWRKIKVIISAISSFWSLQGLLSPSRRARRSSCRCRRCGIQTSTWQKSDAMKKPSSLYIRLQPFNWTKNSGKSICKVTTMRGGRLSESQFTRSLWIFPLFWMFNMPVLSRSNHISECQFRNHHAVEAQTIGCNFRVVNSISIIAASNEVRFCDLLSKQCLLLEGLGSDAH